MYRYYSNCINYPDKVELENLLELEEDITYKEFIKVVKEIPDFNFVFPINEDRHVTFHKAEYNNETYYWFCHSGIEYIFRSEENMK